MTTDDTSERPPLTIVDVHSPPPSREDRSSGEDVRPELSAESLSTGQRLGLLVLTLLGGATTLLTVVVAVFSPTGALGFFGTPWVAVVGGTVILVWMLLLIFGALLENNRALGAAAHRGWIVAFTLTGPLALLFYWWLHVWPSRHVPHAEGARPRSG